MTPLEFEQMDRETAQRYISRRMYELVARTRDLGELADDDPTYFTVRSRAEKAETALWDAITWLVEKSCPTPAPVKD
jgi:hypothetical protein